MKQWEIYLFPFEAELSHPAVILPGDERCQDDQLHYVNALICTSVRLNRPAKPRETLLDEADGPDWKTAVRCDLVYLLLKSKFQDRRGLVTRPRRTQITRKLIESLGLPLY